MKSAKPGSFWHIPATWPKTESAKLRHVPNHDLKLEKMQRQMADQSRVRAERAAKRKEQEADDLFKAADRRERETKMAREKPQKPDDPEQSKAFLEKAKEIGADEEKSAADELMKRLAVKKPEPRKKESN